SRTATPPGSATLVVGRRDRHLNVVRVALHEAGRGDANQLPPLLKVRDRCRAHVTHRRAQPADELVRHGRDRAAVEHLTLDALRHELVVDADILLTVTVLRVGAGLTAGHHRAERTHAPVRLELLAVNEDQLAWALLAPGQQRAQHHRLRAGH